ncbi:MAG TPA: hypothetical protein VGJ13_05370 [Pseudonocardiaceae bacterium]|jgi:hypothetical protein
MSAPERGLDSETVAWLYAQGLCSVRTPTEAAVEVAVIGHPPSRPKVRAGAVVQLAWKLDQLWGWAKSGETRSDRDGGQYYLMDKANVDAGSRSSRPWSRW